MKNHITSCYSFIVLALFSCITITGCGDKASGNKNESPPKKPTEHPGGFLIVKNNCKACHAQGINGAPIIGNKKMWAPRLDKGIDALAKNAASGIGLMPAKGGKTDLSDAQIRQAVAYMLEQVSK
ncbi:MAG: c-type cytochrome [Agarilytica sp.]